MSQYVLFAEPTECNAGVRSGIGNTNVADESGEIMLETQDDSEADEATSPTACSGASMDDILQALHSLGKQNNGIENKMEQQR